MHVIAVLTVRFARTFSCASSYLCYFHSSESDLSTSSTFSTSGTQQTPWKTTPLQWWRPLISSNVEFFLFFRNSGSNFRRFKPQPRLESNLKLRGKGYLNLFSVPQIVLQISVLFVTMFDGSDLLHVNDEFFVYGGPTLHPRCSARVRPSLLSSHPEPDCSLFPTMLRGKRSAPTSVKTAIN